MLLGDVSFGGGSKVLFMMSSAIMYSHEGPGCPTLLSSNPQLSCEAHCDPL